MEAVKKVLVAAGVICLAALIASQNVLFAIGALAAAVASLVIELAEKG